jgi:hypothetical protein
MPQARRMITWISQNRWRLGSGVDATCDTDEGDICQIVK